MLEPRRQAILHRSRIPYGLPGQLDPATIAVDTRVYARLAAAKMEGESFSKAIDRLLTLIESAATGRDILRGLDAIPTLSAADSRVFMKVVAENRATELIRYAR